MASNPQIGIPRWRVKRLIHFLYLSIFISSFALVSYVYIENAALVKGYSSVGTPIDSYQGVAVYSNGPFDFMIYGLSFNTNGYLYGYKWQCVEYVRRFYSEVLNHQMLNGFKHAKYYYDPSLSQGEFNSDLGLVQYKNGEMEIPQINDILVFNYSPYGHVGIVSEVCSNWVEIIQQNLSSSRQILDLKEVDGHYIIEAESKPIAWLRLPQNAKQTAIISEPSKQKSVMSVVNEALSCATGSYGHGWPNAAVPRMVRSGHQVLPYGLAQ